MTDERDHDGDNATAAKANDTLEHAVDFAFCLPTMLVMNFCFAAYFWNLYSASSRLREARVQWLVLSAGISFLCLIGFAYLSRNALLMLNDMSENTIVLTFMIQVTIITRDAMNLCNLVSLHYFMRAAEVLSALVLSVVLLDVVTLALPGNEDLFNAARTVNQWFENASLVFIVSFRFYYILLSRGSLRAVIQNQPGGTLLYAMLVGHEYPFMTARRFVSSSLEYTEGVCMRTLLLVCIWYTTREKQAAYGMLLLAQSPYEQFSTPMLHMRKTYQRTAAIAPAQSATVVMSSMVAANSRRSDQRRASHHGIGAPRIP